MSIMIEIKKQYKEFTLGICIDGKGEALGLLGASGCGKSLTLRCIAGIITPDEGRIILNDRILFDSSQGINLSPRQRNIGMLFQNYALFPNMTVKENIGIGIRNRQHRREVIADLLTTFRLEALQDRYPGQLSGGEQQRTAMARLLAYEPEALLLDEPFTALDSFLKEELQQELTGMLGRYDKDIIMVSHNKEELYRFCETIAVIEQGQLLEYGSKNKIFHAPEHHRTARLTGCRNLSRAVRRSEYEVEAIDWKACLRTDRIVEEDIRYVGIRPEDMIAGGSGKENRIPVSFSHFVEGPREVSIALRSNERSDSRSLIYWTIPLQEWRRRRGKYPEYIYLPKEQILLLK